MPCYQPLGGFQLPSGRITKQYRPGRPYLEVPCGICIGCRIDKSRDWALRCIHEAQCHDENSFLTLTYADKHIPEGSSLSPRDLQLFVKRLRKSLEPKAIRFFACGEYGEKTQRPHYHLCLFGHAFREDRYFWKKTGKSDIYRSPALERIWPYGHSSVGELTHQSAGYTARYVMKKIVGQAADEHYETVDTETGEIFTREREFLRASRNPGIGYDWYQRYKGDLYPKDYVTHDGEKRSVPKYYDRLYAEENPTAFEEIRAKRIEKAKEESRQANQTPERLKARREFKERQVARLKREI